MINNTSTDEAHYKIFPIYGTGIGGQRPKTKAHET
jgi:hypothetical protein